MKIVNLTQGVLIVCLTLVSSAGHAEIYKWVDANGQTHFSERKDDAGKAKAVDLKVRSDPASTPATTSSPQYWQDQERQFRQRQAEKSTERTGLPVDKRPKSLSGGRSDETDASRCVLAREVLSGAVRHGNGAPTDENDRKIAENDIRTYCH
jgi:hypothetical protein